MLSVSPGQRFGRGIVTVAEARNREKRRSAWLICDCGTPYLATLSALLSGGTKSCGCLHGKPAPVKPGQKFGTSAVIDPGVRVGSNRAARLRCGACGREYNVQLGRLGERGVCRCQRRTVRPGQRYGRGVVQAVLRDCHAQLRCDCGRPYRSRTDHLLSGSTRSCGCFRSETSRTRNPVMHPATHGLSSHPLYHTWRGVLRRHPELTAQWQDPAVFIAAIGPRKPGYILRVEDGQTHWIPWGTSRMENGK